MARSAVGAVAPVGLPRYPSSSTAIVWWLPVRPIASMAATLSYRAACESSSTRMSEVNAGTNSYPASSSIDCIADRHGTVATLHRVNHHCHHDVVVVINDAVWQWETLGHHRQQSITWC